jgi:hypothetical protein
METTVAEIADGIYRLSTVTDAVPGGFTFNQFLIKGHEPLLFHTGPKGLFGPVSDAVSKAIPLEALRWIDTPHVPHGWDAGLLFEETTGTLLCGDPITQTGDMSVTTGDSSAPRSLSRTRRSPTVNREDRLTWGNAI